MAEAERESGGHSSCCGREEKGGREGMGEQHMVCQKIGDCIQNHSPVFASIKFN